MEMKLLTWVQILDKAMCCSLCIYTLEKGKDPFVLLPARKKNVGQTGFISLGKATSLEEGKLRIQTSFSLLKKLSYDCILPVAEGLGKYIHIELWEKFQCKIFCVERIALWMKSVW